MPPGTKCQQCLGTAEFLHVGVFCEIVSFPISHEERIQEKEARRWCFPGELVHLRSTSDKSISFLCPWGTKGSQTPFKASRIGTSQSILPLIKHHSQWFISKSFVIDSSHVLQHSCLLIFKNRTFHVGFFFLAWFLVIYHIFPVNEEIRECIGFFSWRTKVKHPVLTVEKISGFWNPLKPKMSQESYSGACKNTILHFWCPLGMFACPWKESPFSFFTPTILPSSFQKDGRKPIYVMLSALQTLPLLIIIHWRLPLRGNVTGCLSAMGL